MGSVMYAAHRQALKLDLKRVTLNSFKINVLLPLYENIYN